MLIILYSPLAENDESVPLKEAPIERTVLMHFLLVCGLLLAQEKPIPPTELSKGGSELKEAFAKAEGTVRLLLIVSPG